MKDRRSALYFSLELAAALTLQSKETGTFPFGSLRDQEVDVDRLNRPEAVPVVRGSQTLSCSASA